MNLHQLNNYQIQITIHKHVRSRWKFNIGPTWSKGDNGRRRSCTFCVFDDLRLLSLHDGDARVRRPQVDADDRAGRLSIASVSDWRSFAAEKTVLGSNDLSLCGGDLSKLNWNFFFLKFVDYVLETWVQCEKRA